MRGDRARVIAGAGLAIEGVLVLAAVINASRGSGDPIVVASSASQGLLLGTVEATLLILLAVVAAGIVTYYAFRMRRALPAIAALALIVLGGVAYASVFPGNGAPVACEDDPRMYFDPVEEKLVVATNCTLLARLSGGGSTILDPGVHEIPLTLIEERNYSGPPAVEVYRLALQAGGAVSNGSSYSLLEAGWAGGGSEALGYTGDPWVAAASLYQGRPVWVAALGENTSLVVVYDPGTSTLSVYTLRTTYSLNLSFDGEEYTLSIDSKGEPVLEVRVYRVEAPVFYKFVGNGDGFTLVPVEIVLTAGASVAP